MSEDAQQDAAERARQLYEEGAAILDALWDEDAGLVRYETPFGVYHDARGSLAYADVLLRAGGADASARAERIISNVAAMQETRGQDAHYGNFRWLQEDAGVTDLNAVEFALDGLIGLLRDHGSVLSAETLALVRRMVALGLDEVDRLDVHPSYTNIALSDICNSVLGGEALGDDEYAARGARRLDEWWMHTNAAGGPHEYNSPTYVAVDLLRLAALAEGTADPEVALKARVAQERLWLHAAARYHAGLAQLAGPHSRSYRDGWTGAGGFLKLVLWRILGDRALRRETPFFPKGREEGHIGVALASLHCPEHIVASMRARRYPYEARETVDAAGGVDISTYMMESYAFGTSSQAYAVGDPPEPWPQCNSTLLYFRRDAAPGYGVLYARYIINDKGPGAVMHESVRTAEDHWEEGRHAGAQHRNRAIVAYGLVPRTRPAHSYKLSVRMLGVTVESGIYVSGSRIERFPAVLAPGDSVVVAEGDAYIAIVPLEPSDMGSDAPIELNLADGLLTLEMYNYRGPAKTFWEHRSQAGPFFKGNVRNAFVLEVAERGAFADADAFVRHIAAARIADSTDAGLEREIAYASEGGSISLRYSLRDMRVRERRFDGVTYTPPMASAGAIDGSGIQWRQSRDVLMELGGARLMSGRVPAWLVADPEHGRYIAVNPDVTEEAPLWLETPHVAVECDGFGFGRVEVDERASNVAIEATSDIAPVRLRGAADLRLTLNGVDVTDALRPIGDGVREFAGL